MVYVTTEWGGFHEPPYTEDEILELARRANGGVVAFSSHQHRPRSHHVELSKDRKNKMVKMRMRER